MEVEVAVVERARAEDDVKRESVEVDRAGVRDIIRCFPFALLKDGMGASEAEDGSGEALVSGVGETGGRLLGPAEGNR